jgi:predicted Fe-Mo cluster-binding NifX family protein
MTMAMSTDTSVRTEQRSEKANMKIAISSQGPDATSPVDPRFGRARYFRVVDCSTGQQTVVDNEAGVNAAQGAGIQAVQTLVNLSVQGVVTGHVGPKAWNALQAAKVAAYAVNGGTVEAALKAFVAGQLPLLDTPNGLGHS